MGRNLQDKGKSGEWFSNPIRNPLKLVLFRLKNSGKEKFTCPVCGYCGPFEDIFPPTGFRKNAMCPRCGSLERHRIQMLIVKMLAGKTDFSKLKILHFAPEKSLKGFFSGSFGTYETADLEMPGVDHRVDLTALPFSDGSYDFIFASHILEHIKNDEKAISEIRRILRPGGIAVLPVPIVAERTIEYSEPSPYEINTWRATGPDYYNRYEKYFSSVERFSSESLPEKYQLYVYEDRSGWSMDRNPMRLPMEGKRHPDIVPVCRV